MLIYVRHGATSLNKGGSEERLRGWLQVPLSKLGEQEMHNTGKRLADMGIEPATFSSSDLQRALQSAQILSKYLGKDATPDSHIRDWNTGNLAGKRVVDVLPTIKELVKNPDQPAPGGEPLNEYLRRFEPLMRDLVERPGIHLVQGHARGATILEGIADPVGGRGKNINPEHLLMRPNVKPGGILIIGHDWKPTIDNPPQKAAQ